MYTLRFELPSKENENYAEFKANSKILMKYLKSIKNNKKFYDITEIDTVFNDIVTSSGIKGKLSVVVVDPTGEPEFYYVADMTNEELLSTQILKAFITFIDTEESGISKIKSELAERETHFESYKDDMKKMEKKTKIAEIAKLKAKKEEVDTNLFLLKTGVEKFAEKLNIPIDTDGEATILDNLDGGNVKVTFSIITENGTVLLKKLICDLNKQSHPCLQEGVAEDTQLTQYLDISDFSDLADLRKQGQSFESMIQSEDNFIFEHFNLNTDDLISAKKRKFIREKFSAKCHQIMTECCNNTTDLIKDVCDLAKSQLETTYVSLKEANEAILQQKIDEIITTTKKQVDIETAALKEALTKEYKGEMNALDTAQNAKYEKLIDPAIKKLNICEINNFTPEQKIELANQKSSVRLMISDTVTHIMNENASKLNQLMSEIQDALDAKKGDFEQGYQLKKDADGVTSANEQELRLKQIEFEKEKLEYALDTERQFVAQKEVFNRFVHQQQQTNKLMVDQFNQMMQMQQMKETSKVKRMVFAVFLCMLVMVFISGVVFLMWINTHST